MPFRTFALAPVTALLGLSTAATERALEALCEAHMLEAPAPDVYQMHDLLRLFAGELAGTELDQEVARESGDRPSLAANMSLRAQTLRRLDRFEEALDQHQTALDLHRELGGVSADFVTALDAYAHTLQALGKEGEATEAWREAAVLAESHVDPRAAQLRERAGLAGGPRLP